MPQCLISQFHHAPALTPTPALDVTPAGTRAWLFLGPSSYIPHPFTLGLGCDTLPWRRLILGMERQNVLEQEEGEADGRGKKKPGRREDGWDDHHARFPGSRAQPKCRD